MTAISVDQSFSVDDIRRIREEADVRYQGMRPEEIARAIHESARISHEIMEELRKKEQRN